MLSVLTTEQKGTEENFVNVIDMLYNSNCDVLRIYTYVPTH